MEIEFERTLEDLVEFNLFHMAHSPSTQRRILITRLLLSFMTSLLFLLIIYDFYLEVTLFSFLVCVLPGVLIYILYPSLTRPGLIRRLKKLLNEGDNKSILGLQTLEISPEGLLGRNQECESKMKWSTIKKVAQSEKYIFLYVSATSALVIPLKAFAAETQRREFLNYVNAHIQPN